MGWQEGPSCGAEEAMHVAWFSLTPVSYADSRPPEKNSEEERTLHPQTRSRREKSHLIAICQDSYSYMKGVQEFSKVKLEHIGWLITDGNEAVQTRR